MRDQVINKAIADIVTKVNSFTYIYEQLIADRAFGIHKIFGFNFLSHNKDFHQLQIQILTINKMNLAAEPKLTKLTAFLESEYERKYRESKRATPKDFVNFLNSSKEQKNHHYTRMVGLLLKEVYAANPDDPIHHYSHPTMQLQMPNHKAYMQLFSNHRLELDNQPETNTEYQSPGLGSK